MSKDEGERAGIENPRRFFRTYNDKANLAPPSEKSDWYCLESVNLQNGGPKPSDELGVVTTWKWPNPFDDVTVADLRKVQAIVSQSEWKENVQAKTWVGKAVAEALDLDAGDPEAKTKIKALLKEWIKNGALTVVKRPGPDRHVSPFVEVGEWAHDQ